MSGNMHRCETLKRSMWHVLSLQWNVLVKLELHELRLNLEARQLEMELEFARDYLSRRALRNAFPSHSSVFCRICLCFTQKEKNARGGLLSCHMTCLALHH